MFSFVFLKENGVDLYCLCFIVFYSLFRMTKMMDYVNRKKKSLKMHIIDLSFWSELYTIWLEFFASLNFGGSKAVCGEKNDEQVPFNRLQRNCLR